MANINKIKLSGTSYDIQDSNAARSVTLTQAEYDALVEAGTLDPNTFYVISDSEYSFDGYWTSAQTQSAITQSVSGKADTSAVTSVSDSLTAHTADTTIHVTAQDKTNWNNKSDFSGDYNDLSNKPTIPTVPTNVSDFTNDAGYITSDDISGKTNQSDFTAHTANTTVHVTASEKSTWNSKSDFSGNYNDLSNKPTIPSKTSDLTNDSNFATTGDVQTATNDMATKTWVGQQGYLTQHQDISGKQDVSGMTAYTTTATTSALNNVVTAHTANTSIHVSAEQIAAWNAKSDFSGSYNDLTNKLSAGTNVSIVDNVISAEGGGGKAVSAGTNISITTGETADTINCTLPIAATSNAFNTISVGTGSGGGSYNTLIGANARCDTSNGHNVFLVAQNSSNSAQASYVNGTHNVIIGAIKNGYPNFSMPSFTTSRSVVIGGGGISTDKNDSVAIGYLANVSGTTKTNINNQLTIDTSNQVYIYNKDNTEMICLQDQLGGSSITVDTALDSGSTNPVENRVIYNKIDEVEEVTAAALNELNEEVSGKQDTLSAGTNITIVDNVISAEGGVTSGEVQTMIDESISGKADSSAITESLATKVNVADNNVSAFSGVQLAIAENTYYGDKNIKTIYIKSIGRTQYTDAALCKITFGNSNSSASFTVSGSTNNAFLNKTITAYTIDDIRVTSSLDNGVITATINENEWFVINATDVARDIGIYYTKGGYSSGQTSDVVENTVYDVLTELGENLVNNNNNNKIDISNLVTTDTEQTISGRKIFTYSASTGKAIEFKQTSNSAKVGFRIINSAETNNEVASFEFRPNTFTIDNVQHPLMYFGHYRTTNTANAGVPQTVIGFRQYDQLNAAAYHYLMPLPEKAKTPFSLTTSFKNYYAPMGFKNGSTMITADDTGVVDFSDVLGGLKLVKLSQSEYDSIATKDNSTLYVIVN